MARLRFNIASLLVIILVLGVGFAALRESNDLWESALFTATIGILLVSVLLAVYRQGLPRAFWLGFAVFGWSYLALAVLPAINARLITTKALSYIDSKVQSRGSSAVGATPYWDSWSQNGQVQSAVFGLGGQPRIAGGQGQEWIVDASTGQFVLTFRGSSANFIRIGHSLFALLMAWLGGRLARRLSQRSSQRPPGSDMVASISRPEPARA
jgi:hypothetical protein